MKHEYKPMKKRKEKQTRRIKELRTTHSTERVQAEGAKSNPTSKLAAPFVTAFSMLRSNGITKRWLLNTFVVVVLVLVAVVTSASIMLRNYYYSSIEQGLRQRSAVTINYFKSTLKSGLNSGNSAEYFDAAQSFTESFDGRDKMEMQFLNATGDIIVSSTGFTTDSDGVLGDYYAAIRSAKGVGTWTGVNAAGEKVIALTRLISYRTGSSAGAVRYVVSMEGVDQVVFSLTLGMVGLVLVIIFLMLLSGSYFVNSIVVPVKQITASASKIADGDFDIRLASEHNDEIGQLVGAINSMAAELADSEKVKNDFISTVSHELRTPLTAIRGWGETLYDCGPEDSDLVRKGMGVIISEAERMCGLVEELLDFSRIQSGRMKMNFAKVDLSEVLADTVDLFTERCAKEGKSLVYRRPREIKGITGDRDRLRQVFVNILDNAIKYTDEGGSITASITAGRDCIRVTVRDSGCGIAKEDLGRVSRKFYKANTGRSGFGIGLAVAEEIISLHGGELLIDSTEGVGTTVTVSVPYDLPGQSGDEA
ncbi:MAG: HAMP domain-containing protein [Ruminococcaceae bacterium]|nr:HAMP domain-containing protein [Oscillospiraceae bacterium]